MIDVKGFWEVATWPVAGLRMGQCRIKLTPALPKLSSVPATSWQAGKAYLNAKTVACGYPKRVVRLYVVCAAVFPARRRRMPKLHSYITVLADQAMQRAAAMDAQRNQGKQLGPLHGVPIAVKDLCHKIATPTTAGHSFRKDSISELDATVVARLETSARRINIRVTR